MPTRLLRGAAAAALLAAAACGSPTEPGRPPRYEVLFIGAPPDAESFSPRAVDGRRVYGVATAGERSWAAVWTPAGFARLADPPSGCRVEPRAARGGAVVGQVSCTVADDVYGWGVGAQVPAGRVAAEPHDFRAVSAAGVVGTLYPRTEFPGGWHRAFRVAGGGVEVLLPPGAEASEAAGIADDGAVGVTAFTGCTASGCEGSRIAVLQAGEWRELPVPDGAERAAAVAMSSAGHVLGHATGGLEQAFVVQGRRVRVLPIVPGTRVVLEGVNALGQAVGTGSRADLPGRAPSEGIVWGGGLQYNLGERLVTEDWQVTSAAAIDDESFIAGTGIERATGRSGAILLIPLGR